MTTTVVSGARAGDKNPRLSTLSAGSLGSLKLDAIRETALRAGRLAEALFDAPEADVVAVQDGRIWRGKISGPLSDDATAARIAMIPEAFWVEDARLNEAWRDHPAVQAGGGVLFCAAAPIILRNGVHLGSLRVFDDKPRPFDADLFARLQDIAAFVSSECDRLLGGEVRRVRELFDQAPGFMAISRGPTHIPEIVNAAFMALVGDRAVVGRPLREAIPEIGGFADIIDEVYRSGEPYVGHSRKLVLRRTPDGPRTAVHIDFVLQPLKLDDGAVGGVFFQGHEVPDVAIVDQLRGSRAELESALAATQTIIDHSHDVICTMDAEGILVLVSQHAEALWGYKPEELIGRPYTVLMHPDDIAASQAARRRTMAGKSTPSVTTRSLRKDGAIIPVMWSSVWSPAHQTMFGIARDMREHLAAEEKLRQGEKMEAVGRLTGGVAHDFNNLLTVIIGSAESLGDGLADRPALKPLADLILEAAERGAELVSRLLTFARNQPMAPQPVDCAKLQESLRPMLRGAIGEAVEIEFVCETPGLRCLADRAQLTSALLNLCLNARDAMPAGGRLTVRAACAADLSDDSGAPEHCDDLWMKWSVSDTGVGMSPETTARALEPFFTTKPVGAGSGLGLSMVYGFAAQAGGKLEIVSAPGAGTTVSFCLPETTRAESQAPGAAAEAAPARRHVLVVEDDAALRGQVKRQLIGLGYRVTESADGREALARLAEAPDIDLMLTDVVMPGGMDGRRLAERARALRPGLPVVFTSGHTADAVLRSGQWDAGSRFLPKPYRRDELARILSEVLSDDQ